MHIGFLSLESPYDTERGGGIAAYLRALIPGLVGAGHRVTVLANSRADKMESRLGGAVRVVPLRLPNLHWYVSKLPVARIAVYPVREIEWSVEFYRAARRVFEDDPVDLLETCETGALLLAWRPIAPLVVRLHGSNYTFRKHSGEPVGLGTKWERRLQLSVLRRAQAITAPSRFQAMEVAREMDCAPDRIQVAPNPIAQEILAGALAEPAAGGDAPTVLYAGRLAKVKGIEPLLEAAKEVRRQLPETRFVLAGPWQMAGKPASMGLEMKASGNAAGLCWAGHVHWKDLIALYRRATVFVMPSYFESFGISVVEAMAFGLPVVATTGGGLPEVVEDGETGILVPPGDPQALSEAVMRLLRDPCLCRKMGQAGCRRVMQKFTTENVSRTMLGIYAGAMRAEDAGERGCGYF